MRNFTVFGEKETNFLCLGSRWETGNEERLGFVFDRGIGVGWGATSCASSSATSTSTSTAAAAGSIGWC